MRRTTLLLLAGAMLVTAGCGKKVMLRPGEGQPLPVKPKTAAVQPGVGQLLTPSSQARPTRSNELVPRSKPLAPDRFDLPPPG
jgi:hypothetical protein